MYMMTVMTATNFPSDALPNEGPVWLATILLILLVWAIVYGAGLLLRSWWQKRAK